MRCGGRTKPVSIPILAFLPNLPSNLPVSTLYDDIPYPTAPSQNATADRLATIATLFGMTPAPISRCRVLELACGDGGNLIPTAFWHPESRFVGVDLAQKPIASGKELAAHLGLRNLTLEAKDILTIGPEFGEFDYIIAHGLYAWVPEAVQEKLLALCRANLAPQGVAFVSYNCYPGSKIREMARDLLSQFVRPRDASPEMRERARTLLEFAAQERRDAGTWGKVVNQLATYVGSRPVNVLAHDEMGETWRPAYFHEFMARADRHDLQYLGDACFSEMNDRWLSAEEREMLQQVEGDPLLVREQYMDFLKSRMFRQTLLCRRGTVLRRERAAEAILQLQASSRLRPVSVKPDLDSMQPEKFRTEGGSALTALLPPMKRLLVRLAEAWPRRLPVADLVAQETSDFNLREFLLQLYASDLISLQTHWNPYVTRPGERPESSRLARLMLDRRDQVTSQEHADVQISGLLGVELLRRLDGTRDRAALMSELKRIEPQITAKDLETSLNTLAGLALLIA